MMRSVYLKTLYDKRYFILGWSLGFAVFAALMAVFFPSMRQEGVMDELLKSMPEAMQGFIGSLSDLSQFDTYIASQLFDIRLPIFAGIMAIILGLSLSVVDEEKGELRTILSLPMSRTKVLVHKWLAMVTIIFVTLVGLLAGMYAVIPFVEGASIANEVMLRLVAMTMLIMVTFGTVPFALGMATGKRSVASGLSIFVVIGSFLLSTFGPAVDWLSDYEFLSLLHYFPAADIVKNGINAADVSVLAGISVALLLYAILSFRRRDVA